MVLERLSSGGNVKQREPGAEQEKTLCSSLGVTHTHTVPLLPQEKHSGQQPLVHMQKGWTEADAKAGPWEKPQHRRGRWCRQKAAQLSKDTGKQTGAQSFKGMDP